MKKLLLGLAAAIVLAACGAAYLQLAFPDVPPARADLKVEATPARLERGRYLANHVAVCMDCHSTRDWNQLAGPMVPGTEGKGGEHFPPEFGFPGDFYARNITPAGIGTWTDGEVLRTFTTGVTQSGRALFPMMPYPNYGLMDEEDAYSIVAYLRTLKPIENPVPDTRLFFPMNLIVRTIPKRASFGKRPDPSSGVAYGKYVATVASCIECHTQQDHGKKLPGMDYAGGFAFPMGGGRVVRSSNITPDAETGIGAWSRELFIRRFKDFKPVPVKAGDFQTVMPWAMYGGMTEQDLGAIYDYLRTVAPVKNLVTQYTTGN